MMPLRRLAFVTLAMATALSVAWLLLAALAPGGWSAAKVLIVLCFAGAMPWLGICGANALVGFAILLGTKHPARFVLPADVDPDAGALLPLTALLVTVRNEDIGAVLSPLRRLLDGLDEAGAGDRFALCVLSDSQSPAIIAAEAAAMAAFRDTDRDPTRIRYRRRVRNEGFKAGNIMEFLDHHAEGFGTAVTLDADSEMTAEAVLRLLRILQARERVGIVQHLTVGLPAAAAFPRLFQFGMRAGMRVWATGQAWWQGDAGPYWGHNAALRIAPFRDHARLAPLPDGRPILSHDQVEAARLRAAGWGVWMWADETGSAERNPPTLPEFLARDSRWLAGNFQYFHLVAAPGFRLMGRWQLVQAILLFLGAPLYVAMFLLASISVALGETATVPQSRVATLAIVWSLTLYAPKLLGYVRVLMSGAARARYGGAARFCVGALAEILFTLLLDAPMQVGKTLAMARVLAGAPPAWAPQQRGERRVGWAEAVRLFWPHTLLGALAFTALSMGSWGAVLWAAPFAGGLLTAIPFCVWTADPRLSSFLQRHRIAAIPEEFAAALG